MFNNVALDVFIGLVMVYLLYSLLMTIVSELIATWLNLRPRILRVSIEKMLNDGYFSPRGRPNWLPYFFPRLWSYIIDLWLIIQRFFLREFKDFKYSFAARFYEMPSIKYLTSRAGELRTFFTQTKPSYISAENFADTLYRLLKENGSGKTDMDKIAFTLQFNSQHIQTGSLKQLRDLAENSGANEHLFKEKLKAWYNETQDRATGWYKRKLGLMLFWLGFLVAAIFNVDSIRIAKILAKDKEARSQLVAMGIEMIRDSVRYNDFINNKGDSVHSRQVIDSGYARISKDIREANLVLGLGWGTSELRKPIVYKLESNDKSFASLKEKVNPEEYKKLKEALKILEDRSKNDIDSISRLQESLISYKVDSFFEKTVAGRNRIAALSDTLKITLQRLKAQKTRDSFAIHLLLKDIEAINRVANAVSGGRFMVISSIGMNNTSNGIKITGERGYNAGEKFFYVFKRVWTSDSFWGFVITGLMISLGAPFWFDLLKRLVALRGSGVKPEEKKEKNAPDPAVEKKAEHAIGKRKKDLTDDEKAVEGLKNLTHRSKDEAGIISIGLEYKPDDGSAFIRITAEDKATKNFLEKKYGNQEKVDDEFILPIEYAIDSEITVHLAMSGSEIENEAKVLGSGTLGCHLKKRSFDGLYFISCWHVMKDNSKWDEAPQNTGIVSKGSPLGRIEKGFLSHHPHTGLDIAIAKYNNSNDAENNADFVITSQHRAVTARDFVLQTPVKVFGKVSGLKNATIFNDRINARIKYPDGKIYLMNDVFSITSKDANGARVPPTKQGDSGALVIDEKGVPLGMIIGGSSVFSYAIKFSNLFDEDKPLKEFFFNI